jgi:adenylate cyclase
MTLRLDLIRDCLEGAVPGVMATCAADGTPNIAYLSQVEYLDDDHVALSFQFFNKTRQNVLANPQASLLLVDPNTALSYRLAVHYLRTETSGPLFERMKAKLAGIASHTGMSGVFVLKGSDIYRVEAIERLPGEGLPPPAAPRNRLSALRAASTRLSRCTALDALFDETLAALEHEFGVHHAMLLMLDAAGRRLYTVASRGYAESGVGSEIAIGDGVIGVAARERTPIRISHMTAEYRYGRAMRDYAAANGLADRLETEIPPPGLPTSRSQLAVPICALGELLGVLYVESPRDLHYSYDDEDALVTLAGQLGLAIDALRSAPEPELPPPAATTAISATGAPVTVRHYAENDSVFLDEDYLIKGVAGAIFWLLVQDAAGGRRNEFSNRELRLDPRLRLPDVSDNLEARLILLQRRLVERRACVQIEKTGRGRFRLAFARPLKLEEIAIGAG